MNKKDPLKLANGEVRFDSLADLLRRRSKKPKIGVTQGGSSRKNGGAKHAATDGTVKRSTKMDWK